MPRWTEAMRVLNRQWLEIYWALHQFETDSPRLAELYPTLFSIYGGITRCRASDWRDLSIALGELDANLAHRAELTAFYDDHLGAAPVRLFQQPEGTALWRYPLLVPSEHRNRLLDALWSEGILDATRWYPSLQPMRRALAPDLPTTSTPVADQLAREIINLPLAPDTSRDVAARAAEIVTDYFDTL
jgi:hypothetical protein